MKKPLLLLIFAQYLCCLNAWEFKGKTYSIPRTSQEIRRPTAYDIYYPTQEQINPEAETVVHHIENLRLEDTGENNEPVYQNRVFDAPAMTK